MSDPVTLGGSASFILPFARTGNLAVVTGAMSYIFPFDALVVYVYLYAATAPTGTSGTPITGQSCVVDMNKNGTTIFTTQANRPTIASGANAQTALAMPDTMSFAASDRLTMDIDYVGSTVAGADLTALVQCWIT